MKYVRTKDGRIIDLVAYKENGVINNGIKFVNKINGSYFFVQQDNILKQANTIEELCDEFVVVQKDFHDLLNADTHCLQTLKRYYEINKIEVLGIYGAIWTDNGLIYVAKMNEKGELELL